ncbi:hypothetical protein [Paenibacillus bovis]|uniref:Uncharacterized protein n=1 Tax=Paenibacillus bovis TaxID=1616788 RepID=A0A172ZAC0_9BACL|nr:hypothetical protein [Paenibacillus bovis]ANF94576.1 hypothetical protein AR543_00035 [Paenibacillus bovis]
MLEVQNCRQVTRAGQGFPSLDWARQYALRELVPDEINFVIRDDDTGEIFMDVRFGSHTNVP